MATLTNLALYTVYPPLNDNHEPITATRLHTGTVTT